MKFYGIETVGNLTNSEFASCILTDFIDAFEPNSKDWWQWGTVCPQCQTSTMEAVVPLKMKWLEGSDRIGDFAASSIVQKKVVDFFQLNDYFIRTSNVEFVEMNSHPFHSRKTKFPIVCTTPYTGPAFFDVSPQYGVHLNDKKSGIVRETECALCGMVRYDMFSKGMPSNFWTDLVIDEEEWNGLKIFGLFEFGSLLKPGGIFLSEEGRNTILKQRFTNVKCFEVGRIEKAGTGIMKHYREEADYDFWHPENFAVPSLSSSVRETKTTGPDAESGAKLRNDSDRKANEKGEGTE